MIRALCLALLVALAPAALAQSDRATEELRAEMVFWESIRASSDPSDYRAYLEQYPNGRFAALARNRLNALSAAKPAAAPTAPAPQAAPARAPAAATAASTWTYRLLDPRTRQVRGQHEARLVSASGDILVEEYLSAGAATRIEHRRGNYVHAAGEITLFSPYAFRFGPPMFGTVENLDARTCKGGWTCSVRGRLVGRERVRVPAGEFNAHRVEITQDWVSPSQTHDRGERVSRTITMWYAEEVQRAVKAIGRGTPSAWVDTDFELELLSYQLQ